MGEMQSSCAKRLSQTAYYLSHSSSKEHGADISGIRDYSTPSKVVFFYGKKGLLGNGKGVFAAAENG